MCIKYSNMYLFYKMVKEKSNTIAKIILSSLIWLQLFCVCLSVISILSRDWIGLNGLFYNGVNVPFLKCVTEFICSNYFEKLSKISASFIAITIFCGLLEIFSVYNLTKSIRKGNGIKVTIISAILIFLLRLGMFIGFAVTMKIKVKYYDYYDKKILGYGGKLWIALIAIELFIIIICYFVHDKIKFSTIEEDYNTNRVNDEERKESVDGNQEMKSGSIDKESLKTEDNAT
ncbi:hypothetical protein SteCoe_981 [Stentor coeruleus]|uniref:Uncharacterized protein n=1 Tax=Stentor coeruleus TaxID=5963 RepID=A0A1R2D2U9_9CILI|nr:hypothetical protein SteCoe_981 [Stentor coeruleus]